MEAKISTYNIKMQQGELGFWIVDNVLQFFFKKLEFKNTSSRHL